MRIKSLFTVPEGTKVTEKAFSKVLLSSICSILLCMACLISTTWAWFTVSIENTDNVIQIADVQSTVTITPNNGGAIKNDDGSYTLAAGAYTVTITVTSDGSREDSFGVKNVYMTMFVSAASSGISTASEDPAQTPSSEAPGSDISGIYTFCMEFGAANEAGKRTAESQITLNVPTDDTKVSFGLSWVKPDNAAAVEAEITEIGDHIVAEIDEEEEQDTEEDTKENENTVIDSETGNDEQSAENQEGQQSEEFENGKDTEVSGDGDQSQVPGGDDQTEGSGEDTNTSEDTNTTDNGETNEGGDASETGTDTPSDTETEKSESTT